MNDNTSSKMWFRLLQHRGFWAVVSCLLALGLVLSGALGASPVQAEPVSLLAAAVDIAVVPSSVTVHVDDIFTLEIWVYPHGHPVDAVDADMTFNPDKLEVLSITGDPSGLEFELYSAFDNTAGTLTHSRGASMPPVPPPSTDFRLCSIEFKAKAATDGPPLAFTANTSAYYNKQPVVTEATDPTVTVESIPVGGVGYLLGPGQMLSPWMVGLTVMASLILGAVVLSRKVHRVA